MFRCALLLVLMLSAPAMAQQRPQGLMWNRSGLPATLPLQVRTDPGQDYYLTLTDPASGRAVLAAYVRGGSVFRVLVPPGDYRIAFAHGTGWRGETKLFGPETGHVALEAPLHFGAQGRSRRAGNLVDLRREAGSVQAFGLCRSDTVPDSPPRAERQLRAAPGGAPLPAPSATLAEPRRPAQVLPPPDQPPPTTPDGALPPFARPFVERPRASVAVPRLPAGQGTQFATPRPRASADARRLPRWKICD